MSLALFASLWTATIARGAEAAPLTKLAGRIVGALPGLSPRHLIVPDFKGGIRGLSPGDDVPAAIAPLKAAILLARAEASAEAPVAPVPAVQILAAINAVLQDVSADSLRSMPEPALNALAMLINAQMDGSSEYPRDAEAVALLARFKLNRLLPRAGKPEERFKPYTYANEGHELPIYTREIPEEVRLADRPDRIFRHYTTARGLRQILEGASLRTGVNSYVRLIAGYSRTFFESLTGVFLTLPGVDSRTIGARRDGPTYYVDVRIPKEIPILEIERGRNFLIPLPARPGFEREYYMRWIAGESGMRAYYDNLPRLEENGGPGPETLFVPVEIVGHGVE